MRRMLPLALVALLIATVAMASGCERMVQVKTGTRVVDSRGQLVSESVKTIRVPSSQAGKYRVVTKVQASKTDTLYAQAQDDIAAGNTDAAAKKLAALLAIDPAYPNAKKQLDVIKSGKKVSPDTGSTGGSDSTPDAPPPATVGGLQKWTPELTGYKAAPTAVDPLAVSRQYLPSSRGKIDSLVIAAEQFRTPSAAKAALSNQVKSRYPGSRSTQTIGGHTTYFGTDQSNFAVIGFVDGSVMVAVEGLSSAGTPKELKSALIAVVKQLP